MNNNIPLKLLASCYAAGPEFIASEHGISNAASEKEEKDRIKRAKIQNVFDGARKAKERKGNANATMEFLRLREQAQQYPKTSITTKFKQKTGISPKEETRTSLIDKATKKYIEGPLGMDQAAWKKEQAGWRRAACVEFLHTVVGRILNLGTGLGGSEISPEWGKILLHQGLGYGPQAPISGFGRMASEVWQIRLNHGGKPKLPPQVQNAPALKEIRKGMKDVSQALRTANPELRTAITAASVKNPSPEALENLKKLRDEVSREKAKIDEPNKKYTYRFAAFKRQYMGKRWGGAVSTFAGSVAAPLNATIPLAGTVAQAATIPLQFAAGYCDYMKEKSYMLRVGAKKIGLSDLLLKESRGKSLDEITEADIDTAAARKLYEQKPEAIMAVTREIYRYKLAELIYEQRKLRADIENENYYRFIPEKLFDQKAGKQKALQDINDKIDKLKIQIGHFERGEADQIDPDQTIGKALHSSWYFVRKGTMARYNNKVGEFWAQTFQRLGNNFHALSSIGAMSVVTDILSDIYGHDMVEGGLGSLQGHDGVPQDSNMEALAVGVLGGQVFAGVNVGVTVIPARDYKDTVDRKALAVPDWIKKELKSDGILRAQLDDAVKKGLISQSKKKRIEKAAAQNEQPQIPGQTQNRKAEKILREWEALKAQVETMQKDWVVKDIIGKDGKPITIDLRDSAACYRENLPMAQRAARVLKAIPGSMISGPVLLVDSLRTRHARKTAKDLVAQSDQLISQAEEILKEKGHAPEVSSVLPVISEAAVPDMQNAAAAGEGTSDPLGGLLRDLVGKSTWTRYETASSLRSSVTDILDELEKIPVSALAQLDPDSKEQIYSGLEQLFDNASQLQFNTLMRAYENAVATKADAVNTASQPLESPEPSLSDKTGKDLRKLKYDSPGQQKASLAELIGWKKDEYRFSELIDLETTSDKLEKITERLRILMNAMSAP